MRCSFDFCPSYLVFECFTLILEELLGLKVDTEMYLSSVCNKCWRYRDVKTRIKANTRVVSLITDEFIDFCQYNFYFFYTRK